MIVLRGFEWVRENVEFVYISYYTDGKLIYLFGSGIPANIAVHIDDEDDDDNVILDKFPRIECSLDIRREEKEEAWLRGLDV